MKNSKKKANKRKTLAKRKRARREARLSLEALQERVAAYVERTIERTLKPVIAEPIDWETLPLQAGRISGKGIPVQEVVRRFKDNWPELSKLWETDFSELEHRIMIYTRDDTKLTLQMWEGRQAISTLHLIDTGPQDTAPPVGPRYMLQGLLGTMGIVHG